MDILALCEAIALLILWAFVWWFVVDFLPIPQWGKHVCHILICFVALMASLRMIGAAPAPTYRYPSLSPAPPSIIAPERAR